MSANNSAENYTELFIRTANILREEQPSARVIALALAGKPSYAEAFLKALREANQTALMDALSFHGYPHNPDHTQLVDGIRQLLAKYAPHAQARQGETGAPSKNQPHYALSNLPWSENTQAKWNLRRMLAHHAKDVPFNLFTIIDLHYMRDRKVDMNWKGLLASRPDKTVAYRKPAYLAAQRVFTIFDHSLERIPEAKITQEAKITLGGAAWRDAASRGVVAAIWQKDAPPRDSNETTPTDFVLENVIFSDPVLADLLTGQVFALPGDRWTSEGKATRFQRIPLYDSPILIAEKSALKIKKVVYGDRNRN